MDFHIHTSTGKDIEMLDIDLVHKFNALSNIQTLQASKESIAQQKVNEAKLTELIELLSEAARKPQCPHCGGPCEQGFDRCKNCGQSIIWHHSFVGKPGTLPELQLAWNHLQKRLNKQASIKKGLATRRANQLAKERIENTERASAFYSSPERVAAREKKKAIKAKNEEWASWKSKRKTKLILYVYPFIFGFLCVAFSSVYTEAPPASSFFIFVVMVPFFWILLFRAAKAITIFSK